MSIAVPRIDRAHIINIAQMRYFNITTIRVRPGHDAELAEARRIINAAHEKASMDEHWATFQVVSGAPSGTYYIFLPMKSMKELDTAEEIHGKGYEAALGEENQRRLRERAGSAVLSTESAVFSFSPAMSVLPEDMIASDPEFWRPKRRVAAKPASGKPGQAKPAGTP
ncbi:MAG: hypothetical protein HY650_07265 [Acidobacteria bacterium]|nr:hypothetical protein [Acidobacteriota bacterium]